MNALGGSGTTEDIVGLGWADVRSQPAWLGRLHRVNKKARLAKWGQDHDRHHPCTRKRLGHHLVCSVRVGPGNTVRNVLTAPFTRLWCVPELLFCTVY